MLNGTEPCFESLKIAATIDYDKFNRSALRGREEAVAEFVEQFRVVRPTGNTKYLKIVSGTSVWGFVVRADGGKFKEGDILKAATWKAPALNRARGNVLAEDFSWVRWTGPEYL